MSVLLVLAAMYPPQADSWSEDVNWVPVPYTTVPAKYDFNLLDVNCPNYITAYYSLLLAKPPSMEEHHATLEALSSIIGFDVTPVPVAAYGIYDIFVGQRNLGVPLSPEMEDLMPALHGAAADAVDAWLGDERYLHLQAGVMLHEFFTQADELISGGDTPRVRIYSAHDLNVYSFEAASMAHPRQGPPSFNTLFGLELRQMESTGEYVVLPIYQQDPDDDVVYLSVADCGPLCPYDTYQELVSRFTRDVDSWRSDCGFSHDMDIDDSAIA